MLWRANDARDRLLALRLRHRELQREELGAFTRDDWVALDAIIEEEHANLSEQRQLLAEMMPAQDWEP
jgi:hypothetical protein